MLVTFLFAQHDRELAFKNLEWSAEIGVGKGHKILVICPSGVTATDAEHALALAKKGYDEATLYHLTDDCTTGWPFGPNFMFRRMVDYVSHFKLWPIFLQESDAWFLYSDSLNAVEAAYRDAIAHGKNFLGYKEYEGKDNEHMNGVGVWADVNKWCPSALNVPWPQELSEVGENRMAFDMAGRNEILPRMVHSRLFQFQYKQEERLLRDETLSFLNPDAKVFHTCKTSKLSELLRKKRNGHQPPIKAVTAFAPPPVSALDIVREPYRGITTDIFIKTYAKVADWHQWAMKSIEKYCTGFRRTVVVGDQPTEGYQQMQIVKLTADLRTDASHILFTDSDCLFVRPVTPETYFRNGKPIWLHRNWTAALKQEGDAVMRWHRGMTKFFGQEPPYEFMCRHPEMIPRWLLVSFRLFCEAKHQLTMEQWMTNDHEFADWNMLGMFAYLYHRESFRWINQDEETPPELTVKQYWGGHTPIEPHIPEMERILAGAAKIEHIGNEGIKLELPPKTEAPKVKAPDGWDQINQEPKARMSLSGDMLKKSAEDAVKHQAMLDRMAKVRAARKKAIA